jgi:uncharacterized protein
MARLAGRRKNYVFLQLEFPAKDLAATKNFFAKAFGWSFADYGAEYIAFANEGLDGGFFQSDQCSRAATGGALLVFYSERLEETAATVVAAGGVVIQDIFSDAAAPATALCAT